MKKIKQLNVSGSGGNLALYNFLLEFQKAVKEGYVLPKHQSIAEMPRRKGSGRYLCQMQLEKEENEQEKVTEEVAKEEDSITDGSAEEQTEIAPIGNRTGEFTIEQKLESATKRKELVKLAEEYNLDIGEKIFNPNALRKHLLKQL